MSKINNHKQNGTFIEFKNGNSISIIWGVGTYSDNYNESFDKYQENLSSTNVEIMPDANEKVIKAIKRKYNGDSENSVIGRVSLEDLVEILVILKK